MRCPACGTLLGDTSSDRCPSCGYPVGRSYSLFRAIARVEDAAVSFILCVMVLLVLVQIGLRDVFSTGIAGGSEIVRHMVLWVAFIGAGLAAREGKHIRIDVAYRMLPDGMKRFAEVVTSLFTTVMCGILLYASIVFIQVDYSTGTSILFHQVHVPVWTLEVVIPIGYCAVMLRFALRCMLSLRALFTREA
ncbi:MAG TPA: TRAP transporter small permease subunit [Deltaproteobacteria bacterium]|nr:TRAP transporter small permease subunit [Deltaproteobacteria bacterium]